MNALKKKLDFARPPVDEVVLSVLFQPLDRLLAPHLGEIWQEFKKDEFIQILEQPLVMPTMETFPGQNQGVQFHINVPELPRIWFIHENDSEILQVQRDRFTFNWRKIDPDQRYPGFAAIFERFTRFYNRFCLMIENLQIGLVAPLQYELTYIDQLMHGDGWNTLDEIGQIYNMFIDSEQSNSFWNNIESVNFRTSFPIADLQSRLHLAITNRVKMPEQRHTLQTDFTVRGFLEDMEFPMEAWFKSARDRIREKFAEMFAEDIQTRVWGRK